MIRLALACGLWLAAAAAPLAAADAEQRIVLPVPDVSGVPREKVTLSIRIPPKIEVQEEIPAARKRPRSAAWDAYEFRPFKEVPRKKFVQQALKALIKKGVTSDLMTTAALKEGVVDETLLIGFTVRIYHKLVDVHGHAALRKLGITVEEIENFQQVIEIMKGWLPAYHLNQVTVNKSLEDMIAFLRKTSGKGQVRIVEVKEQKDGSTVLEIEIVKGE